MTTSNLESGPAESRPKSGWRWPAIIALSAAALFGARTAEAVQPVDLQSLAISAQSPATICEGSSTTASFTVTVNWSGSVGTPTVNLTLLTATPSGVSGVTFTPSSITYHGAASDTSTLTFTTSGAVTQASSFTVQGDGTTLTTRTKSGTYTVTAKPATPTITPSPASVCASSTGNHASGPAGATTYAWSISTGSITSATNIQTITYTAGASGSVTLNLTVTNAAGCSASASPTLVTINANPSTPTITPSPTSVCASSTGNQASGPGGAATYAWSITNGSITSATNIQAITYTAGASGIVTLNLTVTNGSGCSAAASATVVPINANPATPTITPSASSVCASSTGNHASGPAGATTYAWSITNGGITSATNIQTITYTAAPSGTVTLHLTVTNASGCSASATPTVVTINALPATPTITPNPTSVCQSSTGNTAAGPAGATTYAWTITNGTITGGTANSQTVTYTAGSQGSNSGNVTLNLTVTNAATCSASNSVNVPISATSAPSTPGGISGPASICKSTSSVAYSVTADPNVTTYNWSTGGAAGWTLHSTGTNSVTVDFSGSAAATGTLSVTGTNACGTSSSSSSLVINTFSSPNRPSTITGSATACAGSSGNAYSVTNDTNIETYNWSTDVLTGWTINGTGNAITIDFAAGTTSGTLTVTGTNACGTSTSRTLAITVNPQPAAPGSITGVSPVCQNGSYPFSVVASATPSVTYHWSYSGTGAGFSTNDTSSLSTNISFSNTATAGTVSVVARSASSCDSTASTFPVIVNNAPGQPGTFTTSTASVCGGTANVTYTVGASATPSVTYHWSYTGNTGSAVTFSTNDTTSTSTNVTFTGGATPATSGTLSVVAVDGGNGCSSLARSLAITVDGPVAQILSAPTTICPGSPTIIDAKRATGTGGGGHVIDWYLSPCDTTSCTSVLDNTPVGSGGHFVGTGDAGGNITVSPVVTTTYVAVVVQSTGLNCRSTNDPTVTITVDTTTTVADAGPDQTICATTATLAGNPPAGGETGTWSVTAGTGTFSPNANTPGATVNGLSAGLNTFQWSISDGTCSTSDKVDITVNSAPTATASITGPATICPSGSTTLHAAESGGSGQGFTCQWYDGANNLVSTNCDPTVSPTSTTDYHVVVTDNSSSTCVSDPSLPVTVSVVGTISASNPTEFCADDIGGIAIAVSPTTGTTHFQWGYRTVSGGPITDLSGHTNSSYTLQGADFPGPGTYYLVCTLYITGTECNTNPTGTETLVSNELTVTLDACSNPAPPPAQFFTSTTRLNTQTNILQWLNPATPVTDTEALARTDGTYPTDESDPFATTLLPVQSGTAGAKVTFPQVGLSDGTTYYYSLFSYIGTVSLHTYSGGKNVSGTPFSSPTPIKWAFSSAGITLAPPALLSATNSAPGAIYPASNARELHSVNVGAGGGDWPTFPSLWLPFRMNGPSQDRPVPNTFTTFTVGGSKNVLFTASLDGSVYANDSRTGALLWHTGAPLPLLSDYILGAPALIFQEFNPSVLIPNFVFVAANCYVTGSGCINPGRSSIVAVDPASGGFAGYYDGTPDSLQIGVIPGQPIVELSTNLGSNPHRIFFASHSLSGGPTVWALNATTGSKLWGNTTVGDASTQVSRAGTTLYVGDVSGKVYSLDHATGVTKWSYDTGLGSPVKSVVASNGGRVFFSVGGNVYARTDSGLSSSPYWTISTLASPGPPTVVSGGPFGTQGKAYVGTGDGRVCEIDVQTQAVSCVQVGPTTLFQVGRTTFDNKNNLLYVGSEPGQVYAVSVPLPPE